MNDFSPDVRPDPVALARDLGPAIETAADEIERTQRIPEPLLSQLHAARLCRMFLPRSVGGDEVEPWVYLRAIEEISRHDGSVGWNVFVANSAALIAPFLAPDAMRTIFADPRAVVAWGPPNESKAIAVPGGYRVTGQWSFASGCRQATWMGAHCRVVEPDGSLRLNAAGKRTVRTFLFPVSQATLLDNTWEVIGMRGTMSGAYRLDDVFVPEAFSSTREDPALRREPGRLYAYPMQGLYAVGVSGVALGIARAMLDAFEELAIRKTPRNLTRLADNAVVQAKVAQMEARLGAARAYLVETLSDIWSADDSWVIDVPARARLRLACALAIQSAEAVADYCYKAAGVDAIFPGTAFERRFRDMHTLSQQIQSRTAHFESVGQILLGIEPQGTFL
ncbi:MAG TPA: acyl-CoA dehydrogenase family protein [Acetobacteraceae bacterium]|jgi:alkylation response protein AidB-like acyl-CoA dehydrogenase|nr:acyl-CoA dehydrogenase family protein [Acetobacteraceae bacterium]